LERKYARHAPDLGTPLAPVTFARYGRGMRNHIVATTAVVFALVASSAAVADGPRASEQLALARLCASEAGFPERREEGGWRFYDDCPAILSVLRFGGQQLDMTWLGFARAYSRRVMGQTITGPRAWVAHLQPDGSEPSGWPTTTLVPQRDGTALVRPHAPWRAYREAWRALYEHAGQVLRGEVVAPCEGPVSDWGGSMDRERAERIGLIPVQCGTTQNDFYIRPSWAANPD